MNRTDIYLTDAQEDFIADIIKDEGGKNKSEIVRAAIDNYIPKYQEIREQRLKLKKKINE